MPKFKEFVDNTYSIPMINKEKNKKLNPKTNRVKTFKKTRYLNTDIKPSDRTFKNIPKYSTGKNKVRFQDWLLIKGEGGGKNPDGTSRPNSYGKSAADGKWYGWSHRAVYGFKAGDKITGKTGAKKVEYPKYTEADVKISQDKAAKSSNDKVAFIPKVGDINYDAGKYEPDFTIKNDAHAKEVAIRFADSVS